jgi:type I restriction enzyme S subunit
MVAIPLLSREEQNEVMLRVDEAFERVKQIETICQTELARSAALRPSILKDAFAGRLVPQDSADEPASELLARIKRDADQEELFITQRRRKAVA